MSTVPAEPSGTSDAELISAVRTGTLAAYGTLYERHVSAAYNLARQLARSSAEADDLVAEAFAKVLDTLRAGKGPDSAFRAYLLTALRHTAYDKTRKDRRVDLNEDMSTVTGALGGALTVQFSDTAVAGLERTMAAKAFARLPERWQAVLWHTEVEGQSPAEVAPLLGLTPNGVSALAYRAREGLRQAYLQVHLAETTADRCRATADRLGAWTRDGLSKRERAQVEAHLDECERCRALAAELADVNGALRAIIAPLVLGGAALGYLATAGAAKASAATAAGAALATTAAAGVGASSSSAGGAAGAAAAVPRQLLGVAGSCAAIAAAIAVGLASGGGQQIPTVQPQANAPAPQSPARPAPPPAAPPQSKPAPDAPAPSTSPTPPKTEPAPTPAPLPADIVASGPAGGIELSPGSGPTDLPITVRNNGGTKSAPVTVSLSLPDGVRAIGPAGGGSQPASARGGSTLRPQPVARRARSSETVRCPGGTGKVSCTTSDGLEPGESATLVFRLIAEGNAKPGPIKATVTSGNAIAMNFSVPVRVAPVLDGVDLQVRWAGPGKGSSHSSRIVHITVHNTGGSTEPVTIRIDRPALGLGNARPFRVKCSEDGQGTTCTSDGSLEPGQTLKMWAALKDRPEGEITVTATLGAASDAETLRVDSSPPVVPSALPSTTSSTAPSTATPQSSSTSTKKLLPTKPTHPTHSGKPELSDRNGSASPTGASRTDERERVVRRYVASLFSWGG